MDWKLSISMIKVLWWEFQQCFSQLTMLLFEGSSETGLFRHLSNYVFRVRNFGNTKSMRIIFVPKCSKFNLDIKNVKNNWEKKFCFWDNCIWIGIVNLSLLRTGYVSLPANSLANSRTIGHIIKRNFLQLKCFQSDQQIW